MSNDKIEQCAKMVDEAMVEFDRLEMCGPRNAMMAMAEKMRALKTQPSGDLIADIQTAQVEAGE